MTDPTDDTPPPNEPVGSDRPATVEEMAETAVDVAQDVVAVLHEVLKRLAALEKRAQTRGERRSDFRFERYPPAESDSDQSAQLEQVRAAWQRLTEWVGWLVATYRLATVIPACWPEHPTLVEELAGLRVAWVGAWSDASTAEAVVLFHERLFKTRARLTDGNWGRPRCDGYHDDAGLDDPEQFHAWAAHPTRAAAVIAARDRAAALVRRGHTTSGTSDTEGSEPQ
jgi:hypothetical protein